jgi:phage-related minor tail protein
VAETIRGINVKIGAETTALTAALKDVNKSSKDIQTELKQVEKLLKLDPKNTELVAQKQKLLADAVENSKEKLDALKKAQKEVDEQFAKGEISEGQYRAFQREVAQAEQQLSGFENKLKNTGKASRDLQKDFTDMGEKAKGIGEKMSLGITAPLVGGFFAATEGTRELRADMGKLEAAFTTAGYTAEQAKQIYFEFYGILGESDQSVEAVNHLAELTDSQEELSQWTTIATGVYAKFGDSLPIEGLTEAANETAKVGQVTGPLADALNWAGVSEDAFNESLAKCNTEQERSTLITQTLNGLYSEAAAKYREVNAEVIAANEANAKLKDSFAKLGAALEPILTPLIEMVASLAGKFTELSPAGQKVVLGLAAIAAAAGPVLVVFGTIAPAIGAVTAAIGVLLSGAGVAGLLAAFPALGTAAAALGTAFTVLTGPIGLTIAAITALIAIGVALYKNWDDLVAFGEKTWNALKAGWAAGMESIEKAFADFGATIAAKMNEIGVGLITKWEELKNGVIAKVSALKSGVSAKWDEIRASTISKLTEIRDQAITWGKNIIQGLIDGIKSKLGAARDAVGAVGEGIKNKIKSMFDIHSPSRVTYEMGENITQGLADGISDTAGVAVSAANSLAGQVSSALQQANADLAALRAAAAAAAQARNDAINKAGDDAAQGVGVEPSNDPAILGQAQQIYDASLQVAADLAELDMLIASDQANAEKYKEAQRIIYKDFIAAGGLPRYLDPKYAGEFNYSYDYIHHGPNSDKYEEDIQIMKAVQSLISAGGAATVTPGSSVGSAIENAAANLAAKAAAKAQGDAAKAQVNALANQHNQLVYDIRERGVKDYDGTIATQISSLASQIASLITQIEVFDKKAGIKGWKPPTLEQLYMLATGGIVTRPTLAMVGEAGESEAVLPLSNLLPMMTDALLGAVATLGSSTTSIANSTTKQVNLYLVNRGTVVGQGGMEEFARSVSKQISKDFGLAVGGAW